MHGFQLWANLPAAHKMMAPRYQDVQSPDVAEVTDDDGTHVRVVCGEFWGKQGPVEGVAADPQYLDVFVPPGNARRSRSTRGAHAFAYVFEGDGSFATPRRPFGVLTEQPAVEEIVPRAIGEPLAGDVRSPATKSSCRPASRASAFCWSRAGRSRSRSRGTARS